jgi:AP-1 complex subunit beta-1
MSSVYHKPREEFITRISQTTQPEESTAFGDDEEVDEEDRAETRRKVKEEMEGGGGSNGKSKSPAAATGGGAALDLLDLDGGGDEVPAAPVVQKQQVLMPTQAGQQGKSGFGCAAALARAGGGGLSLQMTFTNNSQVPINAFAIQVNKNPFGIGPAAALTCPDLMVGGSQDATLAMTPNTAALLSNTAPTNPLFLQIAIKNSLDIFYFNVPFTLGILIADSPVDKDVFTQVWQRVGEGKQTVLKGVVSSPLTVDSLRNSLRADNIAYVAQRSKDDDTMFVYVAATCSNKAILLAEVTLIRNSTQIEIKTRSEQPALMQLFEETLKGRLVIR